jgi:cation:H+ antiporter
MAISDILGTNLFDVALLFLVDAVDGAEPALATAGRFGAVAALIGILVTALFVAGLAERRDRTVLGIGYDSAAVLIAYGVGIVLLFNLRSS